MKVEQKTFSLPPLRHWPHLLIRSPTRL